MNQFKIILIVIAATVLGLGAVIWFTRPDTVNNQQGSLSSGTAGTLLSEESMFDFGKISMREGNVFHVFKIKNTGTGSVTVDKVYTSCMCTTATLKVGSSKKGPFGMQGHGSIPRINTPIGSGEEATLEVVFDPTAHGPAGVGKIERVVYVENTGPNTLEFQIAADVIP